jgi:hypothetical protein
MANEALARDTVTRGDAVTFEGAFVADPVSLLGPCFPLGGAPEPLALNSRSSFSLNTYDPPVDYF